MELLLKYWIAKYRRDIEFLGVGQKTTVARLWTVKALGMKFRVGLFVERDA